MFHDPCWDDINDGTFQNPRKMRGALGAKWLIGPIICKEFRLLFLRYFGRTSVKQSSNSRGQRTQMCDEIKKKRQDQKGRFFLLYWEEIGGAEPLVLTGGNNCQTPLTVDKEWCYFHTINYSINHTFKTYFSYWAAASALALSTRLAYV